MKFYTVLYTNDNIHSFFEKEFIACLLFEYKIFIFNCIIHWMQKNNILPFQMLLFDTIDLHSYAKLIW